jgi:hypothetical protein
VIAPFALACPEDGGRQRMMNGFEPIMQPDQVQTTADYYNDVFVPLGTVTPMLSAENVAKFPGVPEGLR